MLKKQHILKFLVSYGIIRQRYFKKLRDIRLKIRIGFVSNSSSASYIVDLDKYPTVFSLAREMFKLTINTEKLLHREEEREFAKEDLKRLKNAIKDGIDSDLPLFIPGNYDTIIVKTENYYQVDTDFVYPYSDLEGFQCVGDYCEDFEYPEEYYYLHLGGYGKALDDRSLSSEEARCEKHDKEKMIIKGVIVCPDCFKEQPEIFDEETGIISDLEPREISVINEIENILNLELKALKVLNVLSVGFKITNNTITGLSLYDCGLRDIPHSIKNLKNLKVLYVRRNKLTELPASLFDLIKLEDLDVGVNDLSDFSEKLGNLTNLKSLDLRGKTSRTNITSIPESIGNLTLLKTLNLYGNDLEELPETFGSLKNLKSLDLSYQKLNRLPESFGNLYSLKKLNLKYNKELSMLPSSFGNLISLEEVNLKVNKLNELPESFGDLNLLKKLNLETNNLKTLPKSFGDLESLEWLTISRNKLESLPESFGKLKNLSYLNLQGNNLRILPTSFGELQSIKIVYLKDCDLEGFPNMLCQLTNLQELNLENNKSLKYVSDSIGNMTSLTTLDLGLCMIKTLPDSICQLKALKYLGLWHNSLRSLPDCIGNLTNLEAIDLSYNRFLKNFPKSFKNLVSLKKLGLMGTSLENIPNYKYIEQYITKGIQTGTNIIHYCIATKKEIHYDDMPQFIMTNLKKWVKDHNMKLDDDTIKKISKRLAKSESTYSSELECLKWRYPIPKEIKGKGFKRFSFGRLFAETYIHLFHREIAKKKIPDDLIIDLKIKIDNEDLYILCDGTYN